MTMPCSYRTVECSSCGSPVFVPIIAGRNAYRDRLGRTRCDACTVAAPRHATRDISVDTVDGQIDIRPGRCGPRRYRFGLR